MTEESRVRAAAYIRVSTEEQTEFSPESQRKEIQKYAESCGYLLCEENIFRDEGISGRKANNRPAFIRMIACAKQKPRPFDIVLVWKFSRFARNRSDSILYKSVLRKAGIRVVSVAEPLCEDATSVLMEAVLEAMDEYYSLNLGQEVRRGMEEKFLRGGVVSVPPFGYGVRDGVFVVREEEAFWVRRMFAEYVRGNTLRGIAEMLNAAEICTRRGGRFHAREVGYILKNPFYLGYQRRGENYVRGTQEPIVAEELFLRAKEHMLHRGK